VSEEDQEERQGSEYSEPGPQNTKPRAVFNTRAAPAGKEPGDRSLLGFLDSLFAGAVAFAFAIGGDRTLKELAAVNPGARIAPLEVIARLGPAIVAVICVIDDWVNARPLLENYPYRATFPRIRVRARLWIDIVIHGIAFLWISAAMMLSAAWYLAFAAAIWALGWLWAVLTLWEYKPTDVHQLNAITKSHGWIGLILAVAALIIWMCDATRVPGDNGTADWETFKLVGSMALPLLTLVIYKFFGVWDDARRGDP
jgi:hypothetical protein